MPSYFDIFRGGCVAAAVSDTAHLQDPVNGHLYVSRSRKSSMASLKIGGIFQKFSDQLLPTCSYL